jgi:pimeloyl-ACP methyl ester carboxylesterase
VAPDQRGYCVGARPLSVDDYRVEHLVSDVLALADAAGMDSFDLVGHDWGGMLARLVAACHGDRVRSLSVVSTPHPLALRHALSGGDPAQAAHSGHTTASANLTYPNGSSSAPMAPAPGLISCSRPAVSVRRTREYLAVLTQPGALTAVLNWYRAMEGCVLDDLPTVKAPTLYVWSTGDAALGRSAAEASGAFVSGSFRFVVLDGVSHWIPEAAPQELARLLLDHLGAT